MTVATHQSQKAYDLLLDKMFSGEIAPGSKLIERDLAKQLNVSRMPIRIALSQMVVQGIVVGGQKQRSVRLREYSPDEVTQLYQFREVVECGAARAAAQRATGKDLEKLDDICDQMESQCGQRRAKDRWADWDHAFHETIAQASGNEWFRATNSLLLRQTHFVFYRLHWKLWWADLSEADLTRRMLNVVQVHREIARFIRLGDADRAEQAVRQHIQTSYRKSVGEQVAAPR